MTLFVLAAMMTTLQPVPAQTALEACAAEPDERRLACYDRVLGVLDPADGAAKPTPMSPEAVRAQSAAAARGQPLRPSGAASPAQSRTPVAAAATVSERVSEPASAVTSAPSVAAPALSAPSAPAVPPSRTASLPTGIPVAAVDFGPYDVARVTLANGEVWQQMSADRTRLRPSRRDAKDGLVASVKRGAVGSHKMTLLPTKQTIRVKRVE